jgi:TolA-binding protein
MDQQIQDRFNTLEAKIDDISQKLSTLSGQWQIRPCQNHSQRIQDLERQAWKMAGVIGLVSAMPGVVALFSMITR